MKKIILIPLLLAICSIAVAQYCPDGDIRNCEAAIPVVYPIPVNDELNFWFKDSVKGTVNIKLYDMMGRIIDRKKFEQVPYVVTFQVGYLPGGIYLYEIKNNGAIMKRARFLKE